MMSAHLPTAATTAIPGDESATPSSRGLRRKMMAQCGNEIREGDVYVATQYDV